jgi:RHS repeat-associated protein
VANQEGNTTNSFRYLGRYGILDEGNGLCYARARHFSPTLGRFLTKDPLTGKEGDGQSLNRYAYALNNPIRLLDISGLSAKEGGNFTLPPGYDTSNDEVRPPGPFGEAVFDSLILAPLALFTTEATGAAIAAEGAVFAKALPQIILNWITGLAAEEKVVQQLTTKGIEVLGRQVSIRTSAGRRVIDILIRDVDGFIKAVEVKSGGAIRTALQELKDNLIFEERGVLVGKNAPEALRGIKVFLETIIRNP